MTIQKTDRLLPRWLLIAIIAVLIFFIASVVLFTYVNSTVGRTMGYSSFLEDVRSGRVTKVEQKGDLLAVSEGTERFSVVVPSVLTNVFGEMQSAADRGGHPLSADAYVAVAAPDTSWLGLGLTALLPLAIVIIVFGFVVYILARRGSGHPDAASRLRALDQAWKAGLITDEERDRKRAAIIEGI